MTTYSQISQNKIKTYLIMGIFIFVFTGFFYLLGKYYESPGLYLFMGLSISLISTFISYYYSDSVVLFTTGAKPADKKTYFNFYTVVENLSIASGQPMPKIYVIEDDSPNAFATGRDPKNAVICATTGLLKILDRSELEGVISHELSHIKNYDILLSSLVAVLVGTIAIISDWVMRSFLWGNRGRDNDRENKSPIFFIMFILVLIITPIVATIIQLAVSRKREFLADASGALLTRNPDGLASALVKISGYPYPLRNASSSTAHLFISNPLNKKGAMSWLGNLFSTHPPVEERIKILRSM